MESMLPPRPLPPAPARAMGGTGTGLAWAATAVVALLLLLPLPPPPPGAPDWSGIGLDKLVHALGFFALARLWLRSRKPRSAAGAIATAGAVALFGGLLEVAQSSLGARSGDWGDFAADLAGAALALALARRRPRDPIYTLEK